MRSIPLIISSRDLTAQDLLHHARMQWAVETMHFILNVHFSEDYCRIVNRIIQQNLNIIKQFKANTNSKRAISKIMFDCLLDPLAICSILEN